MDPQLFLSILLLLIVVISVLVASHGAKQTGKKEGTILPIVTSKRTKPKAIVAFRGIGVLALLMLFTVKCISFVGLNGVGNALFSFGGEDMRNQTKPSALFQFGGTSMQPGNLTPVEKPISTADLMLGNRSQLPTYAQQNNVIVMPITDASTNQVDNVDICSIPLSTRREDTWSDDIGKLLSFHTMHPLLLLCKVLFSLYSPFYRISRVSAETRPSCLQTYIQQAHGTSHCSQTSIRIFRELY